MTKAQLVTRIVTGPKPIHGYDDDGKKRIFNVGDKIKLTLNAANRFARYLAAPEVAEAQAKVREAEATAAKPSPSPTAAAKAPGGGASAS